jgi:hypothetical protein
MREEIARSDLDDVSNWQSVERLMLPRMNYKEDICCVGMYVIVMWQPCTQPQQVRHLGSPRLDCKCFWCEYVPRSTVMLMAVITLLHYSICSRPTTVQQLLKVLLYTAIISLRVGHSNRHDAPT